MKTLVIGAGVVGAINAWQLAEAGYDVTLYVRPGNKAKLDADGIVIRCTDRRAKPEQLVETVFRPRIVEHFSPADGYALIIVAVKSTQVEALLPTLAVNAGSAYILFMTHNFWGAEKIRPYLSMERCLFGFTRVIGGWRVGNEINCILFDQPGLSTMLGEASGRLTPRLEAIRALFARAHLRPRVTHDIFGWLAMHYVEFLGAVGGILVAGSAQAFASKSVLVEQSLLATREALDVCRARGIKLRRSASFNLRLFYLPTELIVPLAKGQYASADIQHFLEENIARNMPEIATQYRDVLSEGRRLNVPMPHLEAYETCFAEAVGQSAEAGQTLVGLI